MVVSHMYIISISQQFIMQLRGIYTFKKQPYSPSPSHSLLLQIQTAAQPFLNIFFYDQCKLIPIGCLITSHANYCRQFKQTMTNVILRYQVEYFMLSHHLLLPVFLCHSLEISFFPKSKPGYRALLFVIQAYCFFLKSCSLI